MFLNELKNSILDEKCENYWTFISQPIIVYLDETDLENPCSISINNTLFTVLISTNFKYNRCENNDDLWIDNEKPPILEIISETDDYAQKFLSIHIFKKRNPAENFYLQSLVRLFSNEKEIYLLPGQLTNDKSEYFFPFDKFTDDKFELKLELIPKSLFASISNFLHWVSMLQEKCEKLQICEEKVLSRYAEIQSEFLASKM